MARFFCSLVLIALMILLGMVDGTAAVGNPPLNKLTHVDIGEGVPAGQSEIKDNELLVTAGGADIWGKHDKFRFSYLVLKGNFDVSVQVLSISAAHAYTKAGIMARANLSDSSRHVYFQVFPDNRARNKNNGGCEFQYRQQEGGDMKAIYPADAVEKDDYRVDAPQTWLRMKRHGDVFEAYFSNDGSTWKLYASFVQAMPKKLMVGMAVTAHHKTGFTKARLRGLHIGR